MADVIITPASGLIDFQNTSGISSATIQLDGNGNLALSAAGGDIQIGDTSADIFIGDGINNVDLIFEEDGEIRGLTGKTITLGQSDSFISFAGDITGNVDFTGTLTAGQNGKIVFPDNTTVPDSPTNQQHDYITFGANGSISQVSGRGALLFTSSDDSMVIANGDVGRAFTNSNINVGDESIFLLADNALYVKTDLQEGWGTENNLLFDNTGVLSVNGNTVWHAGNDGSGSGLDADLLDGKQRPNNFGNSSGESSYITNANLDTGYNVVGASVFYPAGGASVSGDPTDNHTVNGYMFTMGMGDNGGRGAQILASSGNNQQFYFRTKNDSGYQAWRKVWHDANDGSGSGLDADTLDGVQASSFLRSDAADSASGKITLTGGFQVNNVDWNDQFFVISGGSPHVEFDQTDGMRWQVGANGTSFYFLDDSNDDGTFDGSPYPLELTSSGVLYANGQTVWTAGNDGSGSSLDADLLDGIQGAAYLRSNTTDEYDGGQLTIRSNSANGHYWGAGLEYYSSAWRHTNDSSWGFVFRNSGGITDIFTATAAGTAGATATYKTFRIGGSSSLLQYDGNNIWHAGNDGSGSGLDADTLDGIQGASFLRSDTSDTTSGDLTISNSAPHIVFNESDVSTAARIIVSGSYLWFQAGGTGSGQATSSGNIRITGYNGADLSSLTVRTGGAYNTIWHAGNDGAGSGLDADLLDGVQGSSFLRSDAADTASGQILFSSARTDFGSSGDWNGVGFSNVTNIHVRDHNNFWFGAGNGTWFTGTANTKSQASGLAADASYAHDLLISTMSSNSTYDRGITFAVDTSGAGNSGWRLGKWHSGDARDSSKFVVDGQILAKAGNTDEYDYYANDYSARYSSQGGESHWAGDSGYGWNVPGVVSSSAIQIQSGNAGTNTRKPQLQFHQYGYGGPAIEYDGPNDTLNIIGPTSRLSNTGFKQQGNTIWHAGNDGSGSGLDADTLDGQQGSYYQNASNLNAGTIPDARIPDTITPATLVSTKEVRTSNGTELVLNAGESTGKIAGQTGEIVYVNAEQGLRVCTPSVSNWGSGYVEQRTNITGGGIFFHRNTTAMGEITTSDTTWLRINQNTAKNIYTPRYIRADGGFFVDGTSKGINGSGNFIGGTIAGASDYGTLLRSNANDIATGSYLFQRNNAAIANGSYAQGNNHIELRTNDASNPILGFHRSGYTATALYHSGYGSGSLRMRNADGNDGPIFSTFNDGAGSGLDADTVDGIQGSALAPIASPTFTGNLTIPDAIVHTGDTNTYIQFHGNDLFRVVIAGAEVQEWGNNYTLLSDNDTMRLGSGSDFRMWFNGADTYFRNYAHADGDIIFQGENSSGTNQNLAIMKCDGTRNYVILYENSAERFRTTSAGVTVTGALTATGNVTAFSDINLKKNIEVIPDALDKVSQLRGVTFDRIDMEDEPRQSGVIAQEVEKVLPEVVRTTEDGMKTVAYGNLVGLLIESIKELKAEVEALKAERN